MWQIWRILGRCDALRRFLNVLSKGIRKFSAVNVVSFVSVRVTGVSKIGVVLMLCARHHKISLPQIWRYFDGVAMLSVGFSWHVRWYCYINLYQTWGLGCASWRMASRRSAQVSKIRFRVTICNEFGVVSGVTTFGVSTLGFGFTTLCLMVSRGSSVQNMESCNFFATMGAGFPSSAIPPFLLASFSMSSVCDFGSCDFLSETKKLFLASFFSWA